MFKKILISFLLHRAVSNETLDSINKSLTDFNNEPEDWRWDYTGYVARCLTQKNDEDKHSQINVEVTNESNSKNVSKENLVDCIQGYLEESPVISVKRSSTHPVD